MKTSTLRKVVNLSLAIGAAAISSQAMATAVIENGFIRVGISDFGTLGSNRTISPGILFDPMGTGAYGVNDFLTPGAPSELFAIKADGGYSKSSNNTGATSFATFVLSSITGTSATATGLTLDGTMRVVHTYSLTTIAGLSKIDITTTLTNLGTTSLTGLKLLRETDPDPDVNAFNSYNTNNVVVSSDQACGTGTNSGQTICINSTSLFAHKAGVNSVWPSVNPDLYLSGVNNGNGDYSIGIGFLLGSLAPNASVTVNYAYNLAANLTEATGDGAVPLPGTLGLLLAASAGLMFRRKAKV